MKESQKTIQHPIEIRSGIELYGEIG